MDKDLVIYNMVRILMKGGMTEEEAVDFLKEICEKIEKGEIG